jgi:hypothetical protein
MTLITILSKITERRFKYNQPLCINMVELRKKDRVIQIPVSNDTYLLYQTIYYKYAKYKKWKSREDMLKALLQNYDVKMEISKYMP